MNLRKATGRECLMEINYTEDRGYLTKYRHRENCQFKQETEKGKVMLPDIKSDSAVQKETHLLSEKVVSRASRL